MIFVDGRASNFLFLNVSAFPGTVNWRCIAGYVLYVSGALLDGGASGPHDFADCKTVS